MARSIFNVPYNGNAAAARQIVDGFMAREGFKLTDYNGTQVYKLGIGMAQAMQFAQVFYNPNEIVIHGWICAGLGSATMGEMDLNGFVGMMPKKALKKRIDKLIGELKVLA